ncbi:alpha-farnesene synthase-like [Solanum dulcamara]|uniref:alpha-farnesene synthase-like n=1 Tax=Solanum dulcamara TaxID=45834 RepID=UPI0024855584|nr:alpha-farnesene synthase-like [Solanum dulcamara]
MACRYIVSIIPTMQTQKPHSIKNQIHPETWVSTYKPNIWKYDHLLSLTTQYSEKKCYQIEAKKLKEEVISCTFSKSYSPVALLELVDIIDKFGLSNYFQVQTKVALEKTIMHMKSCSSKEEDLYATALCFRILREHGYHASQDMTKKVSDIKTLFELLEGSYLSMDGENLLNDIRLFSTKNLSDVDTSFITNNKEYLSNSLNYFPLAWSSRWYDVRRHITMSGEQGNKTNPVLLNLAKLNFNIVQATHLKDLKDVIRWWINLDIVEDLFFTRDRIVECFFFAGGIASEPQHERIRKWVTKVFQLVLIIDDVFDIYGSLADAQQFTRAIDKWDPNEVQGLPECIQICFRALYDTVEDISAEVDHQQKGCAPSAFPCLKQGWLNFCKAMLVEAKWYNEGHIPTLEEYLNNGWISSTVPLLSDYVIYGLTNDKITNETLDSSKNFQEIIYHSSVIFRLSNDQGTSTAELERGDVASSIICYMQQENVSEEVAREHIESIILNSWKKINYHFNTLSISHREIAKHIINVARMGHVMYQFGDGFGVQDGKIQDQILINLIEPIT